MKNVMFIAALMMVSMVQLSAQSVGIGTTSPHPNASLDIKGVNKGLLIPRGDALSRTALNTNTAKGLLMYDTLTNMIWMHNGNGLAAGWKSLSVGTNYWTQSGPLGTEITTTNTGGFWSANPTTVLSDPGLVSPPVSGPGTRMMWIPLKSAFRVGSTDNNHWDAPAIGLFSFAGGLNTIASGSYAIAMGTATKASGLTSTSLGWTTRATGDISASLGFKTYAKSYASLALGRWNDSIAVSTNNTWINTDPLFMIGNGTAENARHNAMVVYKNGTMVLKNPQPFYYAKLPPAGFPVPVSGEGTRLMWLPETSSFRVGTVSDTAWDAPYIGLASFAAGINAMALGVGSTATGTETQARGYYSTAMGVGTRAKGFSSMVIGLFNAPILTADQSDIDPLTPLFIIGNGNNSSDRQNAMVVRKDGFVGLGTNIPTNKLTVEGNANINGTIAIGAATTNASAQLEITSTSKGFLPPRMTFAQRNSIASPATGLIVYCRNCSAHGQVQVYNGFQWTNITGGTAAGLPQIGDSDGGGKVAYIFQPADPGYVAGETHGLIAATSDVLGPWGCNGTNIPGAEGTALGTGSQNTIDIIAVCNVAGIAAEYCTNYNSGGYSDWYLPSKDELNKLYLNKLLIGGFANELYWSSSEVPSSNAWNQYFMDGFQTFLSKTSNIRVRPVRTF